MIEEKQVMPRSILKDGRSIPKIIAGGWQLSAGHSVQGFDTASLADTFRFLVKNGINAFDCADIYTGVEEAFGGCLRQCNEIEMSKSIRIHTKFVPNMEMLENISLQYVRDSIDRSLQRLGLASIDLLQFHWWDFDVKRYLDTGLYLKQLQSEGKIRSLATTNFDVARLSELLDADIQIVSNQIQYSLLDRRPQNKMVAYAQAQEVALLCYGSLAGGFLSEKWVGKKEPKELENRSLIKYHLIIEEFGGWDIFQELLLVLQAIGSSHNTSLSTIALHATLQQPGVSALIVGMPRMSHVPSIMDAVSLRLSKREQAMIDSVMAEAEKPQGDVYSFERKKGGRHASVMRYNLNRI